MCNQTGKRLTSSVCTRLRTRCRAVKTWFMVPEQISTLSSVPGKNSLALLSCSLAELWFCSSVMFAPALPIMLPAAAFDIRNLAICRQRHGVVSSFRLALYLESVQHIPVKQP